MKRLPAMMLSAVCLMTQVVSACPMCKDSIPSNDAQAPGGIPSGFNNTIYVMLGGLFCVLGMISFTLVKGARGSTPSAPGRAFPVNDQHKTDL